MTLDPNTVARLVEHLESAELKTQSIVQITDEHPGMDLDDAYAIQSELRRRKESRGHKTVGLKIDSSSLFELKQRGAQMPVFGFLSDYMSRPDTGEIRLSELIHPRVQAQICIVTKAPLRGPGCHVGAVLAAADFVVPAAEIVDSRYCDSKFDPRSLIADNTSASRFVVGGRIRDAAELDLRTLGVVVEKNGEIVATAAGAAVLGNPLAAVARLANHLSARGEEIPAGTLVMTGGVSEAIAVQAGDSVSLRFQHLGSLSVRFV